VEAGVTKKIGEFFFKYRDILPVPLALMLLKNARPRKSLWTIGLPLIFLGESIRIWSLTHIGPTTRTREICADRLIMSGPYSLTRNPIYFGNALKVLGILFIAGTPFWGIVCAIFYLIEFAALISYEESFLREKFSDEFRVYCERVPVFFPLFRFSEIASKPRYSIWEALYSERRTFASTGLVVFMLVLAWFARSFGDRPVRRP